MKDHEENAYMVDILLVFINISFLHSKNTFR